MGKLRRLVLDVLKPHEPTIIELAQVIADLPGVDGVNIAIYEIDRKVENAKITVEGTDIPASSVLRIIEENGGAVHSLDEVAAGKVLIEDVVTPQDT